MIDPNEIKSHSFVLKIWVNEPPDHEDISTWRGRITHVMEGRYMYVKNLEEIIQFLMPYFKRMGIQIRFDGNSNSD